MVACCPNSTKPNLFRWSTLSVCTGELELEAVLKVTYSEEHLDGEDQPMGVMHPDDAIAHAGPSPWRR